MFRREQRPVEQAPPIDADELRRRLRGARALDVDDQSERLLEPVPVSAAPESHPEQQHHENGATASQAPASAPEVPVPAKSPSPSESVARTNAHDGGDPMSQTDPPAATIAVAKMFEPIRVFQERLSKLTPAFEQVDRLGKEATNALSLVSELAEHLGQFAGAYAPVKAFHGEVTALAEKFDPLKSIQTQLTEMSRSFRDHLNNLVAVMEPASKMQGRLAELAQAFAPADQLKERFQQLAREFEVLSSPTPSTSGSSANGNDRKAQAA
jgi:hypothetical protein